MVCDEVINRGTRANAVQHNSDGRKDRDESEDMAWIAVPFIQRSTGWRVRITTVYPALTGILSTSPVAHVIPSLR